MGKGNLIKLSERLGDRHFIDSLCKEVSGNIDDISDAVIIYRTKRKGDTPAKISRYWFGEESSVLAIGLCQYMSNVIMDYVREFEESTDMNPDE